MQCSYITRPYLAGKTGNGERGEIRRGENRNYALLSLFFEEEREREKNVFELEFELDRERSIDRSRMKVDSKSWREEEGERKAIR